MNKAEEKALKKYPVRSVLIVPARGGGYYADSHLREGFIEGYNQAEKDCDIAKEEMIKRVCDAYCKVCGHYHHTTPNHICRQACDYYKDFIQAMKNE